MHPDPGPVPQTPAIVESFTTISNQHERAMGDRAAVHNLFFGRCPLAALLPWKPDRAVLAVLALQRVFSFKLRDNGVVDLQAIDYVIRHGRIPPVPSVSWKTAHEFKE